MQFFKLSIFSFVYASFLLAPIAASGIPKAHLDLARHQTSNAVSQLQTLPLINLNLNEVVTDALKNVADDLSKASIVGDLVKAVSTQLQASLTNITNALNVDNLDTDSIEELKTSVETIVSGVDQLAEAIKDLISNEVVDRLAVGTVGKETVTMLSSLLKDVQKAVTQIEATVEQSKIKSVLAPLNDLLEPLEEIKSGLESLLQTLPGTVVKTLESLESSVQTVVTDVL